MAGEPAIRVTGLGKRYRIGGPRAAYRTLRDAIADAVLGPFRKVRDLLAGNPSGAAGLRREIWALDDVAFDVVPGEAVGIIGRNGAGKSTLLKVLARITEPTRGRVELRGRTGALLEVGTGFHPELTGRENIHLSGAILGMSRREIAAKLDAIVEFAEIGTFLETPVKHFSSGMFVRLAFSVAAHLEPDILLVDEVLAVGDAAFQRKCLDRLGDLAGGGRTVLFVSHNMAAVSALCDRALLLEDGRVTADGEAGDTIDAYLSALARAAGTDLAERTDRSGSGASRLVELRVEGPDGEATEEIMTGRRGAIVLTWAGERPLRRPRFKVTVYNRHGQPITQLDSALTGEVDRLPASGTTRCDLARVPLSRGRYRLNAALEDEEGLLDRVEGAGVFSVSEGDYYGTGRSIQGLWDVCLVEQAWRADEGGR